mgnify:CR=1 FL=1
MENSPEDGALIGLSTLGPGNYFKLPDKIVGRDGTQAAARTFDKAILDGLVKSDLAVFDEKWEGYAISKAGAKRVMRILLLGTPIEPIRALEAFVKLGAVIGIRKGEGSTFSITVALAGTAYIGADANLGDAILSVKRKVDEALTEP